MYSNNVALGLALLVHVAAAAASVIVGSSSSTVLSVGNAALGACTTSGPHDIMLAQTRLSQRLRGKEAILQSDGEGNSGSQVMLSSISTEIANLQGEMDDAHLACQADRSITQAKLSQLARTNSQVSQDVGAIESRIAASTSQLQPTTEKIQSLRDQIQKKRVYCEREGTALMAQNQTMPRMILLMKAQRLETECRNSVRTMNENLRERVNHLAKTQVTLTQAVSMKTQFQQQMKEGDAQAQRLRKMSQEKVRDCTETAEQYQREICGLVETRQAIYWRFVSSNRNNVIQDCRVTDWTASVCNKSCVNSRTEQPGYQQLTRTRVMSGNQYGTSCPALSRSVTCNEGVLCPVDCQMSAWSGWAKCSRKCGGGEQYRTRTVLRPATGSGAVCGVTAQSKLCNVGACQSSCTFGDWSAWGPCSKRCKWSRSSPVGHASRKRPVVSESRPGACSPADAQQLQTCNAHTCSRNVNTLRCTSPRDMLVVLDGSASIQSSDGSSFTHAKQLVTNLVQHSTFSGDGAALRYSLVLFGAARPQVLSPMTGNKQTYLNAVQTAAFQGGFSNVAAALATANQVSQLATVGDRPLKQETLLLITGSNLNTNVATATAARRLRAVGVRVVVLQVQPITNPTVTGDEPVCQIASAPCADNWMRVSSWTQLSNRNELGKFLATVCPA